MDSNSRSPGRERVIPLAKGKRGRLTETTADTRAGAQIGPGNVARAWVAGNGLLRTGVCRDQATAPPLCAVALSARIWLAAFLNSSSRSCDATSSSSASARSPRNRSGFSKNARVVSSGVCPSATGSGFEPSVPRGVVSSGVRPRITPDCGEIGRGQVSRGDDCALPRCQDVKSCPDSPFGCWRHRELTHAIARVEHGFVDGGPTDPVAFQSGSIGPSKNALACLCHAIALSSH